MKKKLSLIAVFGSAVLAFTSCVKDQSGHQVTGGTGQANNKSQTTVIVNAGASNAAKLKPVETKRGELNISGTVLVQTQTTNILILSNSATNPVSFPSTIIVTSAPANIVVNSTNILILPNTATSAASFLPPGSIIVTSAPANVVVNCGGQSDCDCKKKKKPGYGDGDGGGPSGPGWWIPIISMVLGGTFGRVVMRILTWRREKFERIEKEIAAIEDWVKQQLNKDFPPGFDAELKGLWRGQEPAQYAKELKLFLSSFLGKKISPELVDARIGVLLKNMEYISQTDDYFKRSWFI